MIKFALERKPCGYSLSSEIGSFLIKDYVIVNGYYHLYHDDINSAAFQVRKDLVVKHFKSCSDEFRLSCVESTPILSTFRVNSKYDEKQFHHVTFYKKSNIIQCDFNCEGWQYRKYCYHVKAVVGYLGIPPERAPINIRESNP